MYAMYQKYNNVIHIAQLLTVALCGKIGPPAELQDGSAFAYKDEMSSVWPSPELILGQVAGIDLDSNKNVHVFQRGSRVWDGQSFQAGTGEFRHKDEGPIVEPTLITLHKDTGEVLDARGSNKFYMPHGLTVDADDNVWVTDVAMHQVMKFPKGSDEPELVLGKAFVPGNGNDEFCQPTDVAVSSTTGDIFVSDGYCNSRIMKFNSNGEFITSWGIKNTGSTLPQPNGHFSIPHSITLIEDWDLICVADRENRRIQCFSAGIDGGIPAGTFIKKAEDVGRVYAIDSGNHFLVGVTNRGPSGESPRLFMVDMETGDSQVADADLKNPHDVVADIDEDGSVKAIYVAEIGPNEIRKIEL